MARRSEDQRIRLSEEDILAILAWAGGHPYLTHQLLNALFDARQTGLSCAVESMVAELLRQYDRNFAGWWNAGQRSDGFGEAERAGYHTLVRLREGTVESLAQHTGQSPLQAADALQILVGTGVIRQLDEDRYVIGAQLFEEWVTQQRSRP
jgi:hypothetical protein